MKGMVLPLKSYQIRILPDDRICTAAAGTNLLQLLQREKLMPNAVCGGQGTCGKCRVLVDGRAQLACQTILDRHMTVTLPETGTAVILSGGSTVPKAADGTDAYVLAVDIGTTTIAASLLDGCSGTVIAQANCLNPQTSYGADLITRLQYALSGGAETLRQILLEALGRLTREAAAHADIRPEQITAAAVVGNPAMHHLFLGIDPAPLLTPPYMPNVTAAMEVSAVGLLPISPRGQIRVLPNIAGFVGADMVGCMVATQFDRFKKLTLLIDIGTNGELVLGDKTRRVACSTAAGPAFEGGKISCGMRAADGCVDHVSLEDGQIIWHALGDKTPFGLCGSGLLDLVSVLLETGIITETGYMPEKQYRLPRTDVVLTQKDVREVQLAKAAVRAGIELMCEHLGKTVQEIDTVLLAGAFGSYLNPASACKIGMIPPCLQDRILAIGNAAGDGAQCCALRKYDFDYSQTLQAQTEFLELASLRSFQDRFVDCLDFEVHDD